MTVPAQRAEWERATSARPAPGRLTVIVPAYREAAGIYDAVARLRSSLTKLNRPSEIIVVADGNDDGTAEHARRHGDAVTVIDYAHNRGKGYAIRRGIMASRGDLVGFIDADMELDPDGLGGLVDLVEAGADAAIGSKRHPGSYVEYPPFRRFQSLMYQLMLRSLFDLDVTDTQTGIKVFRGDLLREIAPQLTSDGFAFDLELLVELRARGATIVEGPVHLEYSFASTTGVRAVMSVLRDTRRIHRARRRAVARPAATPTAIPDTGPMR